MKGLEVTFRGKTVFGAAEVNDVIDIHFEKKNDCDNDYMQFGFGGLRIEGDKLVFYTLDYAEDLKIGDYVVIKKREIDKESDPVYTRVENSSDFSEYPPDPNEKAKIFQNMLDEFRKLENKLKEAGLID
jgi:hypothetical protein